MEENKKILETKKVHRWDIQNEKYKKLLGMNASTARSRLRRDYFLYLLQGLNWDFCYRCGERILYAEDVSLDHKIDWYQEGRDDLFWDLTNVEVSHLDCNLRNTKVH